MAENNTNNEQLCLTNEYEVLRRIFNFLSFPDLVTCSKVCEEWKEVVTTAIKQRRSIQAFIYENETESPVLLSDATLTLVFNNTCGADESHRLIMTDELIQIFAYCGIIYVHNGIKHFYRRHRFAPRKKYSTVLRFPPHDQVVIKTFNINLGEVLTQDEMDAKISLSTDVPIKAVMLIAYSHEHDMDQVLLNAAMLTECLEKRKSCALAGCWVSPDSTVASSVAMSITLFAGEKIEAGSCVLDNSHRTCFAISNKVEDFSKRVTQTQNSVMMIFRCHSRMKVRKRYNYAPTENVETWECNSVAKYFPTSPLFGCYGTGEFGHDYPCDVSESKKRRLSFREMEHAFSTILLYIGYKK